MHGDGDVVVRREQHHAVGVGEHVSVFHQLVGGARVGHSCREGKRDVVAARHGAVVARHVCPCCPAAAVVVGYPVLPNNCVGVASG